MSGRQAPQTAGGDAPKLLRSPGSPRPPPLLAFLRQVTEIHRHRQNGATRPSRGYFVLVEGGRIWREADFHSPSLNLARLALDHPSLASGCGEELRSAEAAMGCLEEAKSESGGAGAAGSAPRVPPGKLPVWPPLQFHPVLSPLRQPKASGAQTRDSQSRQLGPLPPTRDIPSPLGNPGEGSRFRAFDATPFHAGTDCAPGFR